ncbi:MAG: hypothetical protein ACOX8K_05845 [Lachnospiraceae bacterium]|jgi:hypothetical protein
MSIQQSPVTSVRLTQRSKQILQSIPAKKKITPNKFINECIEAHNTPSSRIQKDFHTARILMQTQIYLFQNSGLQADSPDAFRHLLATIERSF